MPPKKAGWPNALVSMEKTLTFTVNGKPCSVTTDPRRPLLEVLREELGLTGTKYGCGEGQCRACTVLVDGQSVSSCVKAVGDVDKARILTIEGLARDGQLHPVQQAFLTEGGSQCGYCTPGMIMGVVGLLEEKKRPAEEEVLSRLQRHLCRCNNYSRILKSVRQGLAQIK
jgi:aerobic-type carbon monoxide dehydrogenase small subunit (CoxS/CutS family)